MNAFERLTMDVIINSRRYDEQVVDEVFDGLWTAKDILRWIEEESR